MSVYESMEVLGNAIDSIENLLAAMPLLLPPAVHLEALKPSLEGVVEKLKGVYRVETGDDPWA